MRLIIILATRAFWGGSHATQQRLLCREDEDDEDEDGLFVFLLLSDGSVR